MNFQKSRNDTFRRMILRDDKGNHSLIEIADYEDFMNAHPDYIPKEAEIQVRSTDQLKRGLFQRFLDLLRK